MPAVPRITLAELVALVAPPRCGICGGAAEVAEPICEGCQASLARAPARFSTIPGLDVVWSAVPYEGISRDLVAGLKFAGRMALARVAARAIARAAPADLLLGALVPVPPAPVRRRLRGFDPAAEIAAALAKETGLAVTACLGRANGPRQVGRDRAERLADPPRIMMRGPTPELAILVDDVLTTGATLGSCARAMRGAGTPRVIALTFARSGK